MYADLVVRGGPYGVDAGLEPLQAHESEPTGGSGKVVFTLSAPGCQVLGPSSYNIRCDLRRSLRAAGDGGDHCKSQGKQNCRSPNHG